VPPFRLQAVAPILHRGRRPRSRPRNLCPNHGEESGGRRQIRPWASERPGSWRRSRNVLHGSAGAQVFVERLAVHPRGVDVLNVVGDAGDSAGNADAYGGAALQFPFRLADAIRRRLSRCIVVAARVGTRKRRSSVPSVRERRTHLRAAKVHPILSFFPASSGKTPP